MPRRRWPFSAACWRPSRTRRSACFPACSAMRWCWSRWSGRRRRPKRGWPAFARGWAAGTGYLLVCTNWIVEPFLIDAAAHAWQAPFAVLWCAAGIGSLWGAAGWLYAWVCPPALDEPRRPGLSAGARVLAFAAAFGLWEWLRGHMLTGFPWDLPGETWRAGSPASQGAALVGAYGMTAATLRLRGRARRARHARRPRPPAGHAAGGDPGVRPGLPVGRAAAAAGCRARPRRARPPCAWFSPTCPRSRNGRRPWFSTRSDLYTGMTRQLRRRRARFPTSWCGRKGAVPEAFNTFLAPGSPDPGAGGAGAGARGRCCSPAATALELGRPAARRSTTTAWSRCAAPTGRPLPRRGVRQTSPGAVRRIPAGARRCSARSACAS